MVSSHEVPDEMKGVQLGLRHNVQGRLFTSSSDLGALMLISQTQQLGPSPTCGLFYK